MRGLAHIVLSLFFLSVVLYPLPECYVSQPKCPNRAAGVCPISQSGFPSDHLSTTFDKQHKPHASNHMPASPYEGKEPSNSSSKGAPIFSRLSLPFLKLADADPPRLPIQGNIPRQLAEIRLDRTFTVAAWLVTEERPGSIPLILVKESFLI